MFWMKTRLLPPFPYPWMESKFPLPWLQKFHFITLPPIIREIMPRKKKKKSTKYDSHVSVLNLSSWTVSWPGRGDTDTDVSCGGEATLEAYLHIGGLFLQNEICNLFRNLQRGRGRERGREREREREREIGFYKRVKRHFDVLPKCHSTVWAASSFYLGWSKNNNHWCLRLKCSL